MHRLQTKGRTTAPTLSSWSKRLGYLGVAGFIVLLDQATKYIVRQELSLGQRIRVFDGEFLWWWYMSNPGMAFGVRLIPPWALMLVKAITAIVIAVYICRSSRLIFLQTIPLVFIMGGAVGNFIDRLLWGEVVDFISVDFPDFIMERWPTFNIADSAVSVGVTILIIISLITPNPRPVSQAENESPPEESPPN